MTLHSVVPGCTGIVDMLDLLMLYSRDIVLVCFGHGGTLSTLSVL